MKIRLKTVHFGLGTRGRSSDTPLRPGPVLDVGLIKNPGAKYSLPQPCSQPLGAWRAGRAPRSPGGATTQKQRFVAFQHVCVHRCVRYHAGHPCVKVYFRACVVAPVVLMLRTIWLFACAGPYPITKHDVGPALYARIIRSRGMGRMTCGAVQGREQNAHFSTSWRDL